jgi:prepilin-type processing-associated H-X9-DG protein
VKRAMHRRLNSPQSTRGRGFSVVELLVVIGIIALLIAMLMPAIAKSREQARQVQCLGELRAIGQAAQLHVNEHKGYLPLAGWHWNTAGGQCNPQSLGDASAEKYDYYDDSGIRRPLPVTAALALCLNVSIGGSRADVDAVLHSDAIRRLFHCPSQNTDLWGWSERGDNGGSWTAPLECSSYVFNEALLGRRDGVKVQTCPQGFISKTLAPSAVFFAMDGRPRDEVTDECFLAFDYGKYDTMYDFDQHTTNETTLGKQLLDYGRHDGRANVLFLDWHAETIPMSAGGLQSIGVSKGLYP